MAGTRTPLALCVGAVLGPIAGLALAPFAFVGAACALMSIVLACVSVHEGRAEPAARITDRA
jgi:hypothetical protein